MKKQNEEKQVKNENNAEWYRKKIVEMVEQIEDEMDLKMLYGMAKAAYNDRK